MKRLLSCCIALTMLLVLFVPALSLADGEGDEDGDRSGDVIYDVRIDDAVHHGTVAADQTSCAAGTIVALTVTPDDGYAISWVAYLPESAPQPIDIEPVNGVYFFTMPGENVIVSAEFGAMFFDIHVDDGIEHGAISVRSDAFVDAQVNVNVTPEEGYSLDTLTYTWAGAEDPVPISGFSFIMPAGEVTISATFVCSFATVRFFEGLNDEVPDVFSVSKGEPFPQGDIPEYETPDPDLVFEGWQLGSKGDRVDLSTYVIDGDADFYAIWADAPLVSGHTLIAHPAAPAACLEPGNSAYWECTDCGLFFSDADGEHQIEADSWGISATGHALAHHDAVPATCSATGNIEYWACSGCGRFFSDAAGEHERTAEQIMLPFAADAHTPGDAVREHEITATCTEDGSYDAVVYCSDCHALLSRETVTVPAMGHEWGEWEVTTFATCTPGEETRVCRNDAIHTETRMIPARHALTARDAVAATQTTAGSIAYWTCDVCGRYFSDADGENEITAEATVLPALIQKEEDTSAQLTVSIQSDVFTADAGEAVTVQGSAATIVFPAAAARALADEGQLTLTVTKEEASTEGKTIYSLALRNGSGYVFTTAMDGVSAEVMLAVPFADGTLVKVDHRDSDVLIGSYLVTVTDSNVTVTLPRFSTLSIEAVVAKVTSGGGEIGCASLWEAIAAADAGDTVTLLADVNVANTAGNTNAIFNIDEAITLEGGGKTIAVTGSGTGNVFHVSAGATIRNLKIVGGSSAHGFSLHRADGVTMTGVEVSGCTAFGVSVGSSTLTATDLVVGVASESGKSVGIDGKDGDGMLTIDGSGTAIAGAIEVDTGNTAHTATITLNGGTFTSIRLTDGTGAAVTKKESVIVAAPGGYSWSEADANGVQMLIRELYHYANLIVDADGIPTAPAGDPRTLFCGWYADAAYTTPIEPNAPIDHAYAKFIDAGTLTVGVQVRQQTLSAVEGASDIRFVTTVPNTDYIAQVGFLVTMPCYPGHENHVVSNASFGSQYFYDEIIVDTGRVNVSGFFAAAAAQDNAVTASADSAQLAVQTVKGMPAAYFAENDAKYILKVVPFIITRDGRRVPCESDAKYFKGAGNEGSRTFITEKSLAGLKAKLGLS